MSQTQLTEYEIHEVLGNERRTHLLKFLQQAHGTVALRELSEEIATLETGETPAPRKVRESVYNSLHQTHLPKLDKLSIIDYECDRKLITLADESAQVNRYMESVGESDIMWPVYYLSVGLLALVIITISSFGVPFFAIVSTQGWIGVFSVLVIISALYQTYTQKWA